MEFSSGFREKYTGADAVPFHSLLIFSTRKPAKSPFPELLQCIEWLIII